MMTLQRACETLNLQYDPQARYSNTHKDMLLEDAKKHFMVLIKEHHPDCGGDASKARELIEAHQFLKKNLDVKRLSITEWFDIRAQRIKERKARQRAVKLHKPKQTSPFMPQPKLRKGRPVIQLSLSGEWIREWESAKQAGLAYNICPGTIGKCAKGCQYYHTAAGFLWKYKD